MCGIAGVVGVENPIAALEAVQCMVLALARRGPDSEGIECWPGAFFWRPSASDSTPTSAWVRFSAEAWIPGWCAGRSGSSAPT